MCYFYFTRMRVKITHLNLQCSGTLVFLSGILFSFDYVVRYLPAREQYFRTYTKPLVEREALLFLVAFDDFEVRHPRIFSIQFNRQVAHACYLNTNTPVLFEVRLLFKRFRYCIYVQTRVFANYV